jgi:hypothetical protein
MSYTGSSCIEDESTFVRDTRRVLSKGILLMQDTNAILERLHTDMKNLRLHLQQKIKNKKLDVKKIKK